MTAILGACGCCAPGDPDDDPEEPPPFPPGDDPDPGWVTGFYQAMKVAQVVRDGFPDLLSYYRAIPYDTGERFLSFEENVTDFTGASFRDQRWFFNLADRLGIQGEFVPAETTLLISPFTPYGCRNCHIAQLLQTPDWRWGGGHRDPRDRGGAPIPGGSSGAVEFLVPLGGRRVTAVATVPVPESALDIIEEKLAAVQYVSGRRVVSLQWNPSMVTTQPVMAGLMSGTRWECQAVPAQPDYYRAFFDGPPQAFCLTDRARGTTTDNRLAFAGLKLARIKQKLQFGLKSPEPSDPPAVRTYRLYTIPDGFSLVPGRLPPDAHQVSGQKMPANAEFLEEVEVSIPVGELVNFDPDDQEVYFFPGPTVDELLTPFITKARLYRVFQPTFTRFPPIVQVTPLTVGTRWTHEDRCLKHEVWRSVNGGAEAMVGTIDHSPEEWPPTNGFGIAGWGGYNDPDTGFRQFPLGWEWAYFDTDVAAGNTYTYRVRGYYDEARKSAYSAAYSVST